MSLQPIRLKVLLRQRHWQPYNTFRAEYDKAAKRVDPGLVGTWPSRAQFNRWLSGQLKGLPYPDHCRVLEEMFQGWKAPQLFQPADNSAAPFIQPDQSGPVVIGQDQMAPLVSAGLNAPDPIHNEWGPDSADLLAHTPRSTSEQFSGAAQQISQRLVALSKTLRLSSWESRQLAVLAGNVVDLDLRVSIDIAKDGSSVVTYRHEIFNMTGQPFTRLTRELWFVHTDGPLQIKPLLEGRHRTIIQPLATTPSLTKFACQISPALQPGDTAVVGYTCHGGRFVDEWYWREAIRRHTRYATMTMRRLGGGKLIDCSATVELSDGSHRSGAEGLVWDYDQRDLLITLTSDYLNPNQALVLRWDAVDENA